MKKVIASTEPKAPDWPSRPFVAFDTETTGTNPQTARILQAAIVTDDPSGILREDDRILYIDPGVEIPDEASAIHGITAETLREHQAYTPETGIPYLAGCIAGRASLRGYPLVIYNATYDWPLLLAESRRVPEFTPPSMSPLILDPLVIDRALDKYRKGSRKLEDTARFYGVTLDGAHGAQADARAALGVMRALIARFPELGKKSLGALQTQQGLWYQEWRDHINQYWEKIGKADRVTGTWPTGEPELAQKEQHERAV
jgi:DNA polymerase-3 subunit epsilon